MRIDFGKHQGELVESVILKWPDYVSWLLNEDSPSARMTMVRTEVQRLIAVLDGKPIHADCAGGCGRPATRCSVHEGMVDCLWWCHRCNPYRRGAAPGRLHLLRTYHDALDYAQCCHIGRAELCRLIRALACAKGLAKRVGEEQARAFFVI